MSLKKHPETVYKHADLIADSLVDVSSTTDGLSVVYNGPLRDQDIFKKHFRTDFMLILLVTKGGMKLRVNLKDFTVGENHLIAVAPHAVKQMVKVSLDSQASIVSFTSGFLGKIGMPQNISELFDYFTTKYSPLWKMDAHDADLVNTQIQQLHTRCADVAIHPFGKELLYHGFYTFLYEMRALSLRYNLQENTGVSRKESLVMHFSTLVQQQFRFQRNVQQYARQLFLTPKYLTETIKEITGKNAGEIIDDYVVLEAKLLLDDPTLSIAQIADRLHFSDQSFFSKFFKRHTGLSPKKYRNLQL